MAGAADRCASAGVPCFGPTAALARLESSKGYARQLSSRLGIPGPAFARFGAGDVESAMAWWRALDRPVVVKLDGLAAGKGVTVPDDEEATVAAIRAADGRVRARGADARPGVHAAGAVRRTDRSPAADRSGSQAHRRRRHRPEHRRDGCLRPRTGALRRRRPRGDVRPAGARSLRRRRDAVRRRAVRRADADRRRAAPRRVQRPLRRPRDAGRAPAAGVRPGVGRPGLHPRRPVVGPAEDPPRLGVHRRGRRPRLPHRPDPGRRGSDDTCSR